jgi:hypothetical protein
VVSAAAGQNAGKRTRTPHIAVCDVARRRQYEEDRYRNDPTLQRPVNHWYVETDSSRAAKQLQVRSEAVYMCVRLPPLFPFGVKSVQSVD